MYLVVLALLHNIFPPPSQPQRIATSQPKQGAVYVYVCQCMSNALVRDSPYIIADKLCVSLAVRIGSPNLNTCNFPSIRMTFAYCQGLIALGKDASMVRSIVLAP